MSGIKRKNSKKKLAIFLTLFFIISVYAGYGLFDLMYNPYNEGEEITELAKPEKDKPTVILMAGVDERAGDKGRADSLILGFVDKEKGVTNLVSIPRDSYVDIPGKGKDKINHSYSFGGMSLVIKTVEGFMGIPINYYVKTNMEGLVGIVDILDGVEINVEKTITVVGISGQNSLTIHPGNQTLNGEEAVAYARYRKDSKGDFGRMERQQTVIKAIAKKALRPASIIKAPVLIPEVKDVVETNMSINDMLSFVNTVKGMDGDSLITHSLKAKSFSTGGVSYVKVDETEREKLISQLYKLEQ